MDVLAGPTVGLLRAGAGPAVRRRRRQRRGPVHRPVQPDRPSGGLDAGARRRPAGRAAAGRRGAASDLALLRGRRALPSARWLAGADSTGGDRPEPSTTLSRKEPTMSSTVCPPHARACRAGRAARRGDRLAGRPAADGYRRRARLRVRLDGRRCAAGPAAWRTRDLRGRVRAVPVLNLTAFAARTPFVVPGGRQEPEPLLPRRPGGHARRPAGLRRVHPAHHRLGRVHRRALRRHGRGAAAVRAVRGGPGRGPGPRPGRGLRAAVRDPAGARAGPGGDRALAPARRAAGGHPGDHRRGGRVRPGPGARGCPARGRAERRARRRSA